MVFWIQADSHHHALDLQLQVIFSCRLSIFSFLPAVSIVPVLHFLPVVKDNAAVLRPERTTATGQREYQGSLAKAWRAPGGLPGFQGAGEPLVMSVE